jgi:hypothetical protein
VRQEKRKEEFEQRKQRPLRKMGMGKVVFFHQELRKAGRFGTFPEFMTSSFNNKRDA